MELKLINKKKYFGMIRSFSGLAAHFHSHQYLWEKLSNNFEKIYVINDDNLKYFKSFRPRFYEKNYDYKEISKYTPNNVVLFDPKNSKEFSNFLNDKELIIINNFRRLNSDLKTHFLVKKHNIKQIQITNFGHGTGVSQHVQFNHFFKAVSWYYKILFKRVTAVLSILGFISKIEIRFFSSKKILNNIRKNYFKNFLYKNKLNFAKELILVNSRNYDILLENKIEITEDYIVHLNANLNYWQEVELRGELPLDKVNSHYKFLENFLKKLSKLYKKKVLICIHPGHDIESTKKYFKDFDVVKYKTRECIYKSFIVTNFDSSSVVDAVLLKKKIIGLISDNMSKNEISHTISQSNRCGYLTLNIEKDYNFDHNLLLKNMEKKIENYENNIINNHCFEPNVNGTDKIIKIIKERFF